MRILANGKQLLTGDGSVCSLFHHLSGRGDSLLSENLEDLIEGFNQISSSPVRVGDFIDLVSDESGVICKSWVGCYQNSPHLVLWRNYYVLTDPSSNPPKWSHCRLVASDPPTSTCEEFFYFATELYEIHKVPASKVDHLVRNTPAFH